MDAYTQHADAYIKDKLESLRGRQYSDVCDGAGCQYVDLVLQGGGMLGFGLLGYTYVLEQCGIRFWNIAGTSAGAITAGLIAAVGDKTVPKSVYVLQALAELDTSVFLDGAGRIVELVRKVHGGSLSKMDVVSSLLNHDIRELVTGLVKNGPVWSELIDVNWRTALEKLGLNPGDAFLQWVSDVFARYGIKTTRDLVERIQTVPEGIQCLSQPGAECTELAQLGVVAFDITTKTKAVFPAFAKLYWADPENLNPAYFIRASMAIPLFFEPLVVKDIPQGLEQDWRKVDYPGTLPTEVKFVDGGIASNFPINLFHVTGIPVRPTFGAKLGQNERLQPLDVKDLTQLLSTVLYQAKNAMDDDFLRTNVDYRKLVSYIDTKEHSWLDFDMSEEHKIDLFMAGVRAATDFLEAFSWDDYKSLRRELQQTR